MMKLCTSCLRAARAARYPITSSLVPAQRTTPIFRLFVSSSRWSSSSTPPAKTKRPSPYRLIPISTFLADFAPLHVKGWRLESLPDLPLGSIERPTEGGMVELQDRRLVRRYDFEQGKDGWRRLIAFTQRAGEIVEAKDHHPTMLISPSSDFRSTTSDVTTIPDTVGYVLAISTHTHTPLPPLKYPKSSKGSTETMRPGVTGKDLKLAEKLEEVYQSTTNGAL